jgi:hypothetical protein
MVFNVYKCCALRVGPRFNGYCNRITTTSGLAINLGLANCDIWVYIFWLAESLNFQSAKLKPSLSAQQNSIVGRSAIN